MGNVLLSSSSVRQEIHVWRISPTSTSVYTQKTTSAATLAGFVRKVQKGSKSWELYKCWGWKLRRKLSNTTQTRCGYWKGLCKSRTHLGLVGAGKAEEERAVLNSCKTSLYLPPPLYSIGGYLPFWVTHFLVTEWLIIDAFHLQRHSEKRVVCPVDAPCLWQCCSVELGLDGDYKCPLWYSHLLCYNGVYVP